jgi:hypothetical protein
MYLIGKEKRADAIPHLVYANASVSVPVRLEQARRWKGISCFFAKSVICLRKIL